MKRHAQAIMRLVLFFVLLAALSFAAVWVADHPGRVVLRWEDIRVETSTAVLAAAAALLAAAALVLYRLWRFFWYGPRAFAEAKRKRREQRGYLALTQGLVAAAAGDAKGARRLAKRANALLGEPPLALVLSAQAAQLEGDRGAAKAYFDAMLSRPETEFLGLRGLLVEATKAGDREKALALARRAYGLRPKTPWILSTLLDLETRAGKWSAAEATLKAALGAGAVGEAEGKRHRALILFERARAAAEAGGASTAQKLVKEALKLAPSFVPAARLAAELLVETGRAGSAQKLISEAWDRAPHPELARIFVSAMKEASAIDRVKRIEKLVEPCPEALESRLALAEALIQAELWGLARRELEAGAEARPSVKLFRLLAELEEKERGEASAGHAWLLKASAAPPDPAWVCGTCGHLSLDWEIHCPNCGAFDGLAWRSPPAIRRLLPEEPGKGDAGAGPTPRPAPSGGPAPDAALAVEKS